jgi:hypothetical protein
MIKIHLGNLLRLSKHRWRTVALLTAILFGVTFENAQAQTCATPAPYMSLVDVNVVEATWPVVSGAQWYTIEYRTTPSGSWQTITSIIPNNKTIDGLTGGTSYEMRMKAHCSSSNVSAWSTPLAFTTTTTTYCTVPTGMYLIGKTQSSLQIGWVSNAPPAIYYDIRFKPSTSSTWQYYTASGPNSLRTGLTPGVCYDFQIRSSCHPPIVSDWSQSFIFCTCEPITASANPTSICQGSSSTLSAAPSGSQVYNYLWVPGLITGNSISVSPAATTTYTVIANDPSTGCSDQKSVTVTVTPATSNTSSATACDTYTWSVNGQTYTTSGTYTDVVGCHTEILNLTINNSNTGSSSATACDSYLLPWGTTVTTSGAYSNTYTNAAGCDSVHTVNVTINYSNTGSSSATACDSYLLPWGTTVTTSGAYSHTYTNASGCDSVHTVNVTINYSNTGSSSATACDSYLLPWGTTVTTSGAYSHTYTNAAGCDSVHTVNVTINYSNTGSSSATACDSYLLPWGTTVTTSGAYSNTYTNAAGCDSVHTVNVTINYSNTGSSSATACDSYLLPWGTTVTTSGAYSHTYTNASGCDSVHTVNVTINYSNTGSSSATACDSYLLPWGTTVTTSGAYSTYRTQTLQVVIQFIL